MVVRTNHAGRWFAFGLVLVGTLILFPPTSAGYLQAGVDAARTGVTSEQGPLRDDVAFIAEIPGSWLAASYPLIVGGGVYVSVAANPNLEGRDTNGVVRVDIATAEVEVIVERDPPPHAMASDGKHLYMVHDLLVEAHGLDGSHIWHWEREPTGYLEHAQTQCAPPALKEGTLYLLCADMARVTIPFSLGWIGTEAIVTLTAIHTATGEEKWFWSQETVLEITEPSVWGNLLGGVSVIEEHVVVTTQTPGISGFDEVLVQAFDASTGQDEWSCSIPVYDQLPQGSPSMLTSRYISPATGSPEQLFFVARDLHAIEHQDAQGPGSECTHQWRQPLPQQQSAIDEGHLNYGGSSLAATHEALFVASQGALFRFDRSMGEREWEVHMPTGERFEGDPIILAGGILYVKTEDFWEPPHDNYIYAIDPETGAQLWKYLAPETGDIHSHPLFRFAVAQGVLAVAGRDGTLHVIGETPASIRPVVEVSTAYPKAGEPVTVDLSNTQPGVHGDATMFRAVWDDGTGTGWQDEAVFVHTYTSEGDHVAEFTVRNPAGQTTTSSFTFHVGQEPPQELNLLQRVFAPQYQNLVFGMLGVLMAVGGSTVGVIHHRRSRSRLQHEIKAANAIHQAGENDPAACTTALNERIARARGMVIDGKLSEAQYRVLHDHIDGLVRTLRIALVDDELDFLPMSLVKSLQSMLADGRITAYEREAFTKALEADRTLTKKQKTHVRRRLDSWFTSDAMGNE